MRGERFVINDASGAGAVRRAASQLATSMGFKEGDVGRIALVATEVAQNIFAHARSGEVFLRPNGQKTIELLAVDKGPGMRDVAECMRDGFSTAGTQGMGLGMLKRMASSFEVYSREGRGVVAFLEVRPEGAASDTRDALTYGVVCAPHPAETVMGDNFSVQATPSTWRALVVDGLGHGSFANEAATEAVRVFDACSRESALEIMNRIHAALRKTRGAAGAIVTFDSAQNHVQVVGVGNISASLLSQGKIRNLVSHNGTLGVEMRRLQEFSYPCPHDALLVICSDGISTHWKLDDHPGLLQRHPSIIAAVLYRDFSRGRDDATVLCARRGVVN